MIESEKLVLANKKAANEPNKTAKQLGCKNKAVLVAPKNKQVADSVLLQFLPINLDGVALL